MTPDKQSFEVIEAQLHGEGLHQHSVRRYLLPFSKVIINFAHITIIDTEHNLSASLPDPEIGQIGDVARAIMRARADNELAPVTFLIGAGCSVSAGIPLVNDIAQHLCVELAKNYGHGNFTEAQDALNSLTTRGQIPAISASSLTTNVDWGVVYDALFSSVYTTPDDGRDIFKKLYQKHKPLIQPPFHRTPKRFRFWL